MKVYELPYFHNSHKRRSPIFSINILFPEKEYESQKLITTSLAGEVKIWPLTNLTNTTKRNEKDAQLLSKITKKFESQENMKNIKKRKAGEAEIVLEDGKGAILCNSVSPSNDRLFVGDDRQIIYVYDVKCNENQPLTVTCINKIKAHSLDINCLVLTSKYLISASLDGTVNFYSIKTLVLLKTLSVMTLLDQCPKVTDKKKGFVDELSIIGISVDPSERWLTIQTETTLYIFSLIGWQLQTYKRSIFKGKNYEFYFGKSSWTADGRYLAVPMCFNGGEHSVEILKVGEFESVASLIGAVGAVEIVSFCPVILQDLEPTEKKGDEEENPSDGTKTFYLLAIVSQDKSLSIWTSVSSRPILVVKNFTLLPVMDMKWSQDGTRLYLSSYDGIINCIEFDEFVNAGIPKVDDLKEKDILPFSVINMRLTEEMKLKETEKNEEIKKEKAEDVSETLKTPKQEENIETHETNNKLITNKEFKNEMLIRKKESLKKAKNFTILIKKEEPMNPSIEKEESKKDVVLEKNIKNEETTIRNDEAIIKKEDSLKNDKSTKKEETITKNEEPIANEQSTKNEEKIKNEDEIKNDNSIKNDESITKNDESITKIEESITKNDETTKNERSTKNDETTKKSEPEKTTTQKEIRNLPKKPNLESQRATQPRKRQKITPTLIAPLKESPTHFSSVKNTFLAVFKTISSSDLTSSTEIKISKSTEPQVSVTQHSTNLLIPSVSHTHKKQKNHPSSPEIECNFKGFSVFVEPRRKIKVFSSTNEIFSIAINPSEMTSTISKTFVELLCFNDEYLVHCQTIRKEGTELFIHQIHSGILLFPAICFPKIFYIDIFRSNLLILLGDSVRIFCLKRCREVFSEMLPTFGTLISVALDAKYFLVAVFTCSSSTKDQSPEKIKKFFF